MNEKNPRVFPTKLGHLAHNYMWPIWAALAGVLVMLVVADLRLFGTPFGQIALAAVIIALVFGTSLLVKPALGFTVLILSFFSLHWLTDALGILPKPLNLLPDVLVILLFLRGLGARLYGRGTVPRTPVDVFVLLFVGLATLSFLFNSSDSLLVFFNGLFRQNLKFILLFYAVVYSAPSKALMQRLILLFVGLVLAQVPTTIVQSVVFEHWDFAGGTLGHATTGVLALIILMTLSLLLGFAQAYRRPRYLGLGLLLVIPVVLGEGKVAFIFALPLLMLLLSYRWRLFRPRNLILLVGSVVLLGLALLALDRILPKAKALDILFSPAYALNYYERSLAATGGFPRSRLGDLQFTAQLLQESPARMLIGYGPGSSSPAFVEAAYGSLYRRFEQFEGRYFYFSFTQLSMTALEYGLVGLLIHLLVLFRLYRWNGRFLARTKDKFWWAIAWGYRGVLFVYVAGIIYWRIWSTEILASWFWMLSGMLWVQASRERAAPRPLSELATDKTQPVAQ